MPSKKKKYNARFPPARIKKIMQTDEDVGKVAAAVPVIISRALELFIDSLIEKTATITREKHAKTLSTSHIKKAIHSEKNFDFLRDLVKNIPDHQADEEDGGLTPSGSGAQEPKPKQVKPRKPKEPSDKGQIGSKVKRGPGRPRKVKDEEKKESTSTEEDSEETDTDEEQAPPDTPGAGNPPGGLFLSPPPPAGSATPVNNLSPGLVPNAHSAPQTSSNVPGTSSAVSPMQPPFQAYPMHNIPMPQYPFPMPPMAQCNPPQFMPPMLSPYMTPFMNMPQSGFMMPPPPPQEGSQFINMSPAGLRQPMGVVEGAGVRPPNNSDVSPASVQNELSTSNHSDNVPLDMSVSGISRSHIPSTQPQGPGILPVFIPNQNDSTVGKPPYPSQPHGNNQHHMSTGNNPHHMSTGNNPHHMSTGTIPHHLSTGNDPYHMSTGNNPHHLSTGSDPHHMSTGKHLNHMSTGNNPHHLSTGMQQYHPDQSVENNGPISNTSQHYNTCSSKQYDSTQKLVGYDGTSQKDVGNDGTSQKHVRKAHSDSDSVSTGVVVDRQSVPKDDGKVSDQKSIQYDNLSSLMNKASAKSVLRAEEDDDYDA